MRLVVNDTVHRNKREFLSVDHSKVNNDNEKVVKVDPVQPGGHIVFNIVEGLSS